MVNILFFSINLLILVTGTYSVHHYDFVQRRRDNSIYSDYAYNPGSPNFPDDVVAGCNGTTQSPINIETEKTETVGSLKFESTKWTEKPTEISVQSNGYNVIFKFKYADQALPTIYLNEDVYKLEQLHFHFGLTRNTGTEHHINNRIYAMEGHTVFYNQKYDTFQNALPHRDGLVVVGRLYNEDDRDSQVNVNFEFLQSVRNPNDVYRLNKTSSLFSLEDITGPLAGPGYTYHGSLTIPNCSEAVTWIISATQLQISTSDLTNFRQLTGDDGLLAPNIRPLQNLNGRTVKYYTSFNTERNVCSH